MEKKKILLIDDDRDFARLVKMNLEDTGRYDVRTENAGEAGLSSAMAYKPDLILLDVVLGDVDGAEIAVKIKASDFGKDIPIVYLTAIIREGEEKRLPDFLGGHPFLAKPVSTNKLIECVENNIRR